MEEFIHMETGRLYKAVLEGGSITWPDRCRNCERDFSEYEKTEICQAVLKNPLVDLITVVRNVLFSSTDKTTVNYCCINNLRPCFQKDPKPSEGGVSGNPLIFVEEGLTEWYDLTWEEDDDTVELLAEKPEFSLFTI
jgi:hypothetical protein